MKDLDKKGLDRREFLKRAGIAAAGLGLMACAPAAAPTPTPTKAPAAAPAAATPTAPPKALEPIKVGSPSSSSGYMAAMGTQELAIIAMLEEKVNKEGGINGRPLKVIYYDDESDESKGVLVMKKLIEEDKVLAIVGTAASGIALAQAPIVEEAKVPWILQSGSYAVLVPPKKWIFKPSPSESTYVGHLYKFMKERGITRFAWLNQGAAFGRTARTYMEGTVAQQGLTVVAKEEYGPTDTDMRPQLTKIKAANPQALIVYGAEAAGAIAVRQAKELGITVPILGATGLATAAILAVKELADGLEGFIPSSSKIDVWEQLPDTDPQKKLMQEFDKLVRAKYGDKYKRIEMVMGIAYDSFTIMMNAIKKANPDPTKLEEARAKIRDAVEQTKGYIGPFAILDWTPTDHEGVNPDCYTLAQIKGGLVQLLK